LFYFQTKPLPDAPELGFVTDISASLGWLLELLLSHPDEVGNITADGMAVVSYSDH